MKVAVKGSFSRWPPVTGAFLAGLLFTLGCSQDVAIEDGWAGTVDTLPTGTIHVVSPASGLWAAETSWSFEEDLRLGSISGEDWETFGEIYGLEADSRGRIYILDFMSSDVRTFDRSGAFLQRIGGSGEGPGEFVSPFGLALDAAENLWVVDLFARSYSQFDTAGTFLHRFSRDTRFNSIPWLGVIDPNGDFVDTGSWDLGEGLGAGTTSAAFRHTMSGVATDTLPFPPHRREVFEWVENRVGRSRGVAIPFTPQRHMSISPEGEFWFGISDRYRIYGMSLDGDTVKIVERAYDPVPVTASEREEALDGLRSRTGRARVAIDASRIPEMRPPFWDILWDSEGNLWVRLDTLPEDEGKVFDVFDTVGRYLGQLRSEVPIEEYPRPLITENYFYGVTKDDFDVQYVVRLRIGKPES